MTLALDGTVVAQAKRATISAALTTTNANDVIVALIATAGGAVTVSTVIATGLTFHQRHAASITGSLFVDEWYAVAASAFNGSITATISASTNVAIIAFGVSGANTTALWDTNAALPNFATVTAASITGTVSTTFPNDFVFQVVAHVSTEATATIPATFTVIEKSAGTMGPQGAYLLPSGTLSTQSYKWTFPTSRAMIILSDALQPATQDVTGAGTFSDTSTSVKTVARGKGIGSGTFSDTSTSVKVIASGLGVGNGRFATSVQAISPHLVSGEGQFAGTHHLVVSQVESGEGAFAGTHTLRISQVESGEGRFAGAHSFVVSQVEPGEGRFAGTHALVASGKSSGAGTFAGTHTTVFSQVEAGEGRFAGTHSLLVSGKGVGEGQFSGAHSLVVSGKTAGEGSFAASATVTAHNPGGAVGKGRFAGVGVAIANAKVSGAGLFHDSVTEVASGFGSGLGTFKATVVSVASGKGLGIGTFHDLVTHVSNESVKGTGRFSSSVTFVVTDYAVGEGVFAARVSEVASAKGVGEGGFSDSVKVTAISPFAPNVKVGFGCSITVYAYANSSALIPFTARHEQGGTTAPTLHISWDQFAFNVNVLTSPYASEPPPDGGTVKVP